MAARAGLAVLVLAGAATAARAQTPSLYADCRGAHTASPTVILEAGAFGTSADWDLVLGDLAAGGRVCAYDRSGVGASRPPAGPKDVVAIARELAALLDRMGEARPVILVGHSNGALYAETFAALWPQRVSGLVYVNGVTSNDRDDPALIADLRRERRLANLAATAGELGLAPLVVPSVVAAEGLPPKAAHQKRLALSASARLRASRDEDRQIVDGLGAATNLGGSPASLPTAVITSISRRPTVLERHWLAAESLIADRAQRHWLLVVPGATHVSPLSRDRAYVVAAVDWLRAIVQAAPAGETALPGSDIGH